MLLPLSQQWSRPSISVVRSGPSLWTYLELLIQPGILPCSPKCLPMESNANSTLGLLASFTLTDKVWCSTEPFHLLVLPKLEYPEAVFSAAYYSSSSSMISQTLWKILFISLLMTPLLTMTSLILLTDRQQPLPSPQTDKITK